MQADFYLGDWIVRPRRGRIERGDRVVHIHPKPMAVLERLASANGEVVTRDELHESVWPGVIVTDDALTQCIAELRKAFGDSAKASRVIKTIPKTGFCLVPRVEHLSDRQESKANRARKRFFSWGFGIAVIMLIATWRFTAVDESPDPGISSDRPSVAVLPFANRSANPDDAFFVEGIHDDLIAQISQIAGIKTISRTSVMQYRGTDKSIREIATDLGVTTVLEGGIQRAGNQVRINVQLIDARTDGHLWSETFDRQLTTSNLFAIQSEISEKVATELHQKIAPIGANAIPTESMAALEAYFRGRQSMTTRTTGELVAAENYFRQAVELDPGFALAWVGLADTYLLLGAYSGLPGVEIRQKSRMASERALELDPTLAEAHAALAKMRHWSGDFEGAEQEFRKAIELNPNYAPAYQWYGQMLGQVYDRIDEALELSRKSIELDPKSAIILCDYAGVLENAGKFEEALAVAEMSLLLEPELTKAYRVIGKINALAHGRIDESIADFHSALRIEPDSWRTINYLGQAYLNLGAIEATLSWLETLEKYQHKGEAHWLSAQVNLMRGNEEQAATDAQAYLAARPGQYKAWVLLGHLLIKNGDPLAAYRLYERIDEKLVSGQFRFNRRSVFAAVDLAYILLQQGKTARAQALLTESLGVIQRYPRLGEFGSNILEVKIRTLLGEEDRALVALKELVDSGWRMNAWYHFEYDPTLRSLRSHPIFNSIRSQVEADLAEQRKRVEARESEFTPLSTND